MDFLPLHLFPERALEASVITTVWVGVMIGALLNLRFGWLLTGLIVPGYLVPLLIQKPSVVAVIVVEATLTYGIVWLFSERLPRLRLWSNSFGMDRFFSVILSAVIVRVVVDGALLPIVGEWLNRTYGLNFDYRANLQSYGLTMIALMAYGFVRSGLTRGLVNLSIHLFLTWAVVFLVLMKFTNFNLAGLSFLYEEVASSVLSSPKTYIIMIVTAVIASRMNLFYGWDFNGILVPAFIAMQWNQPMRILGTFAEAMAVLFISRALLRLPIFQRLTIEKGRQIILFFSVSFLYKATLGYLIPVVFPEAKITDYFGFGYVLCSLIAMRIHSKGIGVKLTNCTLQTSAVSVLLATGLGFGLAQAQVSLPWLTVTSTPLPGPGNTPVPEPPSTATLEDHFNAQRVGMYAVRTNRILQPPLPGDLERFREAVSLLVKAGQEQGPDIARARDLLATLDYELRQIEGRYWFIREKAARRGWGMFMLDPWTPNPLLVEVPAPMEESGSFAGGYRIFRLLQARSFSAGTNLRRPGQETTLDPLLTPRTFLAVWHQVVGRASTLQVRGSGAGQAPQLKIKRELPEGLDLTRLESRVGRLGSRWAASRETNVLADLSRTRFAELTLPPRLFLRLEPSAVSGDLKVPLDRRPLQEFLVEALAAVAPEGSERYTPPRVDELLALDEEVLTPLHALITRPSFEPLSQESRLELAPIAASAAIHGYALRVVADPATHERHVVLVEAPDSPRRWGTLVLRAGLATNVAVQVPRPGQESGSLEFGHWAFEHLQARLLMVAGALPLTRKDRSSDCNRVGSSGNLLALSSQVLLRESNEQPGLVLQIRGLSTPFDAPILRSAKSDLLLGEIAQAGAQTPLDSLHLVLTRQGFTWERIEGQEASADLQAETVPSARYLRSTRNKAFVSLWVTLQARQDLLPLLEDPSLSQQLRAVGLPPIPVNAADLLVKTPRGPAVPEAFLADLRDCLDSRDIVRLDRLRRRWAGLDLRCWVDRASGRPLLVAGTGGRLSAVASLGGDIDHRVDWKTLPEAASNGEARVLLGTRTLRLARRLP